MVKGPGNGFPFFYVLKDAFEIIFIKVKKVYANSHSDNVVLGFTMRCDNE